MPLADSQCLALWERAAPRHPIDRALLLAAVAAPGVAWADRPLGRRDATLIGLRCDWFGPRFEAQLACPACGELLAVSLDLQGLVAGSMDDEAPVEAAGARFRRPTSRDLAALVDADDVDNAARELLDGIALDGVREWSAQERAAIETALEAADPLAHITLDLGCSPCGHRWHAPLDIGATLWDELAAVAGRVADEVHALASAYGWSEAEILAMPAARRRLYIERVAG